MSVKRGFVLLLLLSIASSINCSFTVEFSQGCSGKFTMKPNQRDMQGGQGTVRIATFDGFESPPKVNRGLIPGEDYALKIAFFNDTKAARNLKGEYKMIKFVRGKLAGQAALSGIIQAYYFGTTTDLSQEDAGQTPEEIPAKEQKDLTTNKPSLSTNLAPNKPWYPGLIKRSKRLWNRVVKRNNIEFSIMVLEKLDIDVLDIVNNAIENNNQLKPEFAEVIGDSLFGSLYALARIGVIHADIKLENIFVKNYEGPEPMVVKLGDFGMARRVGDTTAEATEDFRNNFWRQILYLNGNTLVDDAGNGIYVVIILDIHNQLPTYVEISNEYAAAKEQGLTPERKEQFRIKIADAKMTFDIENYLKKKTSQLSERIKGNLIAMHADLQAKCRVSAIEPQPPNYTLWNPYLVIN